jgi:2,4-dienoyl-CoA reductase-like NADH-dependent reductase (Old Yellow Enzyme family)
MSGILSQPLTLPCGVSLSNRLAKSATQEGLADTRGHASDALRTLYRRWSQGGAGLLISGDVMVDKTHRERPGNVVIDGNGGLKALESWAKAGRSAGNHFWIQLNQPGRQTPPNVNPQPLGPSATNQGLPQGFGVPRAMNEAQIWDLIARFGTAAAIARDVGFSGVQLHGAHGFMASAFLSPIANQRTDAWGGPLENRARFLIESLRAVRRAVGPHFPVSIKLNSADFEKGGFTVEESIRVIEMLNPEGIDLLEISGGNVSSMSMVGVGQDRTRKKAQSTLRREAYFRAYAAQARPVAKMPLMMTGGFRTVDVMEEAIVSGDTDVIGFARPFTVAPGICRSLLDGSAIEVPAIEEKLLLDRTRYPDLDDRTFNLIESFSQLAWANLQLFRLGNGLDADWSIPIEEAQERCNEEEAIRERARMAALESNNDLLGN